MIKKISNHFLKGRVVLIESRKKKPLEEAWTLNEGLYERVEGGAWKNKRTGEFYKVRGEIYRREPSNYPVNHSKVKEHLEKGGNIGYLLGSDKIYVLDWDTKEHLDAILSILGDTLVIETTKGYHFFFRCNEDIYKTVLEKESIHFGEILGIGQQVLIPPSVHPSGKEYKILKNNSIAEITKDKLELIKKKFSEKRTYAIQSPDWTKYNNLSGINIGLLLPYLRPLKKYGNELYGSHPVHGSTTKMNFFVNPSKGVFHCFRHDSGGDALALISILEGICSCEDFKKGGKKLRGEDFKKTLEIAKEKYNIHIEDFNRKDYEKMQTPSFEIRVITAKELSNMDIPPPEWIVKDIIPKGGLVIIAGKTASMKSFLSTTMGMCSVYGMKFLKKFKTVKGIWLYFDEENPLCLTKDRNEKILKGLNAEAPENFKYVCYSGLKLDVEEHLQIIEKIIVEQSPSVIVLDSFVRFLLRTDENDAGEISNIFTTLRNLAMKHKTTFLVIHHVRKGSRDKRGDDNDDVIRGSTDIVNAVDCILLISRKDKSSPYINVRQTKNRYMEEIDPFVIFIKQGEENKGLSFEVTANAQQELSIADKAANEILDWLMNEKEWEGDVKIFKTSEVIDKFSGRFHKNFERNRKIIGEALNILVIRERIKRGEKKGYYLYADLIEEES